MKLQKYGSAADNNRFIFANKWGFLFRLILSDLNKLTLSLSVKKAHVEIKLQKLPPGRFLRLNIFIFAPENV